MTYVAKRFLSIPMNVAGVGTRYGNGDKRIVRKDEPRKRSIREEGGKERGAVDSGI